MQIDIENGRRFNEEPAISAVSSGADIVLVRLADGTGVKALPLSALRDFAAGDITALETEDKTSLVAAVNELLADIGEDRERLDQRSAPGRSRTSTSGTTGPSAA